MSTKFTEYKGLDLPTVASEVLDFWKKNNVFEQSVTSREGATPYAVSYTHLDVYKRQPSETWFFRNS